MNEMEQFLNFGAVVKINRSIDDDLLKFINLIKSVGFLKEYIEYFEKSCCFDKKYNEFSESAFWHYVEINKGDLNNTCIEFQWSKGFTWGDKKDYLNYDSEMKILTVDELIIACNKEELFKMNGEYTNFKNELEDKESASELDDFLNFYEWSIYKYPDGKYNIKDTQCNTFDFDENTTFEQIIVRVYFRMFDYFTDEEELEDENIKQRYEKYIKVGDNLKLLDEHSKQQYEKWYQEVIQKDNENTIENDYNYN